MGGPSIETVYAMIDWIKGIMSDDNLTEEEVMDNSTLENWRKESKDLLKIVPNSLRDQDFEAIQSDRILTLITAYRELEKKCERMQSGLSKIEGAIWDVDESLIHVIRELKKTAKAALKETAE